MILGGLSIMTGKLFRVGAALFFLCFTYVEVLDKTNYLNHYYFVSILSLLLLFSNAHKENSKLPTLNLFRVMIGIVYFYGSSKTEFRLAFNAQPLALWLPVHSDLPIIGELFK